LRLKVNFYLHFVNQILPEKNITRASSVYTAFDI